jgi:hypothetical protein
MKLAFAPLDASLVPACRAFNERLCRQAAPPFLLPQDAPSGGAGTQYVAVDQHGEVRGGVRLVELGGWLAQREVRLVNIQSPLSEGMINRTYASVGFLILRFVSQMSPFAYAVGMGGRGTPFAQLLRAAGWSVTLVPFYFDAIRPRRVLPQLGLLQRRLPRALACVGAASGLASAAPHAWRALCGTGLGGGLTLDPAPAAAAELDAVWARCRSRFSFAAVRDAARLALLHPDSQARLRRFVLRRGGEAVGWSVSQISPMCGDRYFGDLCVGTVLDAVATAPYGPALVALTRDALGDLGCDLVITNQSHALARRAFVRAGFLRAPSNYVLALSPAIAESVRQGSEPAHVYATRADGDGRIHL